MGKDRLVIDNTIFGPHIDKSTSGKGSPQSKAKISNSQKHPKQNSLDNI